MSHFIYLKCRSWIETQTRNFSEQFCAGSLHSTECKPNYELSSQPFAISVPVHYDSSNFQHSCNNTKVASPCLTFQGNSLEEVENLSGTVANEQ